MGTESVSLPAWTDRPAAAPTPPVPCRVCSRGHLPFQILVVQRITRLVQPLGRGRALPAPIEAMVVVDHEMKHCLEPEMLHTPQEISFGSALGRSCGIPGCQRCSPPASSLHVGPGHRVPKPLSVSPYLEVQGSCSQTRTVLITQSQPCQLYLRD